MSAKHIPQRSPDQTRLSFSLSKDLRQQLEAEAKAQKRSLSNLITILLDEHFSIQETPPDEEKTIEPVNGGGRPPRKVSYRTTKRKSA